MIQTLQLNTVIEIPQTHVLIEKEEYERLITNDVLGETGDSKWLEQKIGCDFKSFARNVLEPNKDELKQFVRFPDLSKGQRKWLFKKTEMSLWLEENWHRYMK